MPTLTMEQIYAVALQAGFSPEQAVTFTAIAYAESRGNTTANAAGAEDSRGLWQINVSPGVRGNTWGDLYDPLTNARAAYEISRGGVYTEPWSVTHPRHAGTAQDYRGYLDEARAAAAAVGADGGAFDPTTGGMSGPGGGAVEVFVEAALAQVGDRYVFGHDVALGDPNPTMFDCSELVEWAAHQAGVQIRDGTWNQYLQLQGQGTLTSVEQALRTRGALLFTFSETPTPGGGRPDDAHVAISLGDGRVVEAADPGRGVVISPADPDRFTHAGVIGGLGTATPPDGGVPPFDVAFAALPPPTDSDGDGLTDEFELLLGTDPQALDTDEDDLSDVFETTQSHTDPSSPDTDADSVPDALEVAQGSDAGEHRLSDEVVAAGFGGAATVDSDDDGLSDLIEQELGSNREAADTDHDGVSDDFEYALGSDLLSIDTNRDGLTDGVAYDLGILGPRSAQVTAPGTPGDGGAPDGGSDGGPLTTDSDADLS
ncbi:NlpC/P60 family protein [Geodermatophilus sp. SYSU D00703]